MAVLTLNVFLERMVVDTNI